MPTLLEIIRALVGGDRSLLTDAEWVAKALRVIDEHLAAERAAKAAEPDPAAPVDLAAYRVTTDGSVLPPGVA